MWCTFLDDYITITANKTMAFTNIAGRSGFIPYIHKPHNKSDWLVEPKDFPQIFLLRAGYLEGRWL